MGTLEWKGTLLERIFFYVLLWNCIRVQCTSGSSPCSSNFVSLYTRRYKLLTVTVIDQTDNKIQSEFNYSSLTCLFSSYAKSVACSRACAFMYHVNVCCKDTIWVKWKAFKNLKGVMIYKTIAVLVILMEFPIRCYTSRGCCFIPRGHFVGTNVCPRSSKLSWKQCFSMHVCLIIIYNYLL